jgi:16S rRNA (guanine966-N2)-methyltransferase
MRIIAGRYRSRVLEAPAGMATRPTSDRLRETLFNVLAPRMEGCAFLDLYAGSGAVGLEALSRGAVRVVCVERGPAALKALRGNVARLGVMEGLRVEAASVPTWLKRAVGPWEIVFLDPPYDAEEEYERTLGALGGAASGLLAEGAVVIAEHRRKQKLAEAYGVLKRTRLLEQGDAALSFYGVSRTSLTSGV